VNPLVWQVCQCGLSNILTDKETIDVDCPQCNSPIAPIAQPQSMQSKNYKLTDVFSHLEQDVYKDRKPKLFGKYNPKKEVCVVASM